MGTDLDLQTPPATKAPSPVPRASRSWLWSLLIGLGILGLIGMVPLTGDISDLHTWTLILMFCVLAQSWNFIGGFTGYAAFGNVAFFGIGAYSVAILLNDHQPFWLGLIVGALIAGLFAFLLGLPVLRLKGHYFAIATLGVAEALREFSAIQNIGGPGGEVSVPFPGAGAYPTLFYVFFFAFLALALACLIITILLTRSKFGYALVAIRENEQAAEALGIATYRYKIAAFVLSAIPTGLAGGLYAYFASGFDPPTVFDVGISVEMVLLTFLGGAGTILGPVIGAIIFEYGSFQLLTSGFSAHNTLLGLAIVIITIFLPQGLVRLVEALFYKPAPGAVRTNRLREGVRRVRRFIAANGI
ncbi:MAG TPA: branched-chain amino acid ABC transporter permease [Ktedonobacterales bacterium]|jgi:branched-chain amino acid transport system permease protein